LRSIEGVATPTWLSLPNCIPLSVTPAKAGVPLLVLWRKKEKRDSRLCGNDDLVIDRHFRGHAVRDEARLVRAVVEVRDLLRGRRISAPGHARAQRHLGHRH